MTKGLIEIIHPKRIDDLEKYCSEENGVINLCYGYDNSYCPKTCSYAEKRETQKYER